MKINLLLLFFVFNVGVCFSQNRDGEYLVFLLKKSSKNELHKGDIYIWALPKDSIGLRKASPFYITGFSKTALTKCANGQRPRLFMLAQSDEWDFSDDEKNAQLQIENLFRSNQQKIARISIEAYRYKEQITVSVIAIKGTLCNCPISEEEEGRLIGFSGNILMAVEYVKIIPISIKDLDISKIVKSLPLGNFVNRPF